MVSDLLIPKLIPSFLEDEDLFSISSYMPSGVSVFEDDKNVYIEVAMPGIDSSDIDITRDRDMLWIRGEKREEEEDKKRKYYRKMARAFSYRVPVPSDADYKAEPDATYDNGVLRVTFSKLAQAQPKKIMVKAGGKERSRQGKFQKKAVM